MAPKFQKISYLFWNLLNNIKTSGRFLQIWVAFSENLNFDKNPKTLPNSIIT